MFEHENVLGDRCAGQAFFLRNDRERGLQGADRREIEIGIAPLQHFERIERMRFQPLHQFVIEGRAAARGPECAVAHGTAGAAGDLRQFGRIEIAELIAVEFAIGCEGDVIDVEIEPHADGIGRHQIIDVAGLKQRDLRVAGARRERAQHHRRAAALAADQFGDRVNFIGRERDNGRAARQPRQFLVAGECQHRQPRPRHDMRAGQ